MPLCRRPFPDFLQISNDSITEKGLLGFGPQVLSALLSPTTPLEAGEAASLGTARAALTGGGCLAALLAAVRRAQSQDLVEAGAVSESISLSFSARSAEAQHCLSCVVCDGAAAAMGDTPPLCANSTKL